MNKKGNQLGVCWRTCIARIEQHKIKPIKDWNHYQLLGYLLSKTINKFEACDVEKIPAGYHTKYETSPSRHPKLENMRNIFRKLDKDPIKTKIFLDWCLKKYMVKLSSRSLRFHLQEYLLTGEVEQQIIPDRTTLLPEELRNLTPYIIDYGTLATRWNIHKENNDDFDITPYMIGNITINLLESIT